MVRPSFAAVMMLALGGLVKAARHHQVEEREGA
jgi:hypothetical protein